MTTPKPLLLELGCEELPANQVAVLAQRLASGLCAQLVAEQLVADPPTHRVFATPRRLAVLISDVLPAQTSQRVERKGPAIDAAFDASGQPTKAAEGFAKSVGLSIDALERLKTDQGEWLTATIEQPGQTLDVIVQAALDLTIKEMASAKSMRWHTGDERFLRPVRWLVVMHGERCVETQLFGLSAQTSTYGHRVHAPGPYELATASDYERVLTKAQVLPTIEARRARIEEQVEALATQHQLSVDAATKQALIEENANLVEWPVAILGSFDEAFLTVPEPALISAMQLHQKCFPMRRSDDQALSAQFIAIANIESQDVDAMRAGFERVIRPRLADAEFFWNQDCATPLAQRAEGLADMLFQKELGTVADKISRLQTSASWLAQELDIDVSALKHTISLIKCDLLTEMVGEFPELQGVMGAHYALASGESSDVATAIEQHYWPKNAGDHLPSSPLAVAIALLDRADTLVGVFGVGLKPKGSKDPFALRRAAQGLVRILEQTPAIGLASLLEQVTKPVSAALHWSDEHRRSVVEDVMSFCLDRTRSYANEQGMGASTLNAVFATPLSTISDLMARAKAVESLLSHRAIDQLVAANKRLANLLSKNDEALNDTVDPSLFSEPEENELHKAWSHIQTSVSEHLNTNDYTEALSELAQLAEPLDAFFEKVMVMAEDKAARINRLSLLHQMRQSFLSIADLAQLGR